MNVTLRKMAVLKASLEENAVRNRTGYATNPNEKLTKSVTQLVEKIKAL